MLQHVSVMWMITPSSTVPSLIASHLGVLFARLCHTVTRHLTSQRGESLASEVLSNKFHLHNKWSTGAGQDPHLLSNPAFILSLP